MSIRNRLSRFANRYKELLEETKSSESAWQEARPMRDLVKETGKIVGISATAFLTLSSLSGTWRDGGSGFGYYVGDTRLK